MYISDFSEQYLNNDNVPLAIEKCVNFVSAHGTDTTGVYRLAGSHGKIERLVDSLKKSECRNSLQYYATERLLTPSVTGTVAYLGGTGGHDPLSSGLCWKECKL